MVATPSKGCTSCRKRKKGCHRKIPSCGQCLARGRPCGGYVRTAMFIHYQPPSDTSSSPESNVVSPSLHDSNQNHSLSQTAYQSLIVDQFWTIYLPAKELRTSRFSDLSTGWYDVASCQSSDDPALKHALLALSLKRLSLGRPDDVRRQYGMKMYGTALRELNAALRVKERRTSDEILYACTALTLYEIFEGTASTKREQMNQLGYTWLSHMAGILVLMQVRGPERRVTGMGHYQFRWIRMHGVSTAQCGPLQRPTLDNLLSNMPDHLRIPSPEEHLSQLRTLDDCPLLHPPQNLGDRILDTFARVPGMLDAFDAAHSSTSPPTLAADHLDTVIYECQSMAIQLRTWYTDLLAFTADLAWPAQLLDSPHTTPLTCFSLAHITMLDWALSTVVHTNLHQALRERHALDPTSPAPARFRSPDSEPGQYASNIRRAAPYFFRPGMHGVGATNASFPMAVAALFFGASGRTGELEELLKPHVGSPGGGGVVLLGFLGSLRALGEMGVGRGDGEGEEGGVESAAVRWWGFAVR